MSEEALPQGERVPAYRPAGDVAHLHVPFGAALRVSMAAGFGYGFDAYAVNIFGMLTPFLQRDLDVSLEAMGLIGSIFLVGYTIGTVGFGFIADRIGRRHALGWSIILYGFTTALGGLSSNLYLFTFLRFLTGVGGAGELAVGAPYTAEMWPKEVRALGTGGIMFSLYSVGYVVAAMCALYIVPRFGWQWAFIFAIVPAAGVFLIRHWVQESARYEHAQAEVEQYVKTEGKARPRVNIFSIPGARRRIVIGWLLYIPNACVYWSVTPFLTTFMVQKFHTSPETAISWAAIFYIVQAVLALAGTFLSDLIGRRPAGILGALIIMVCTLIASHTDDFTTFLRFGAIMIGMLGWLWGISDTYISEFFRTSLRATGFGIMVGGGRVASIFAPYLLAWGLTTYGPSIPFMATALLWIMTIVGYLLGPETAGKELEEVQL